MLGRILNENPGGFGLFDGGWFDFGSMIDRLWLGESFNDFNNRFSKELFDDEFVLTLPCTIAEGDNVLISVGENRTLTVNVEGNRDGMSFKKTYVTEIPKDVEVDVEDYNYTTIGNSKTKFYFTCTRKPNGTKCVNTRCKNSHKTDTCNNGGQKSCDGTKCTCSCREDGGPCIDFEDYILGNVDVVDDIFRRYGI